LLAPNDVTYGGILLYTEDAVYYLALFWNRSHVQIMFRQGL